MAGTVNILDGSKDGYLPFPEFAERFPDEAVVVDRDKRVFLIARELHGGKARLVTIDDGNRAEDYALGDVYDTKILEVRAVKSFTINVTL